VNKFAAEELLYQKADAAGRDAAARCKPVPMIVGTPTTPFGNDMDPAKPTYFVEGGVCGFAWVTIRPARGKFVSYLKSKGLGNVGYYGGYQMSSRMMTQSMAVNEAYCEAFANVLRCFGVKAHSESRID